MIKLKIATDGEELYDEEIPSLKEVALIIYRMETIKKFLLEKKFDSKFKTSSGSFAYEE